MVPCWNEGETLATTIDSLLALDYPRELLKIVLINDGSTDNTAEVMQRFEHNPQVHIIHKENGGKHTAVNAGIAAVDAEIVGCLDADSFVERGALREMIPCFDNPRVAAATAAMSVHQPRNILQHMQNAEYILGITLKHAMSVVNGIHVTPGPFSLYRRQVVLDVGGFKYGHQTEDLEMALRLHATGWEIDHALRARVYTNAPGNVFALIRQRTRWNSGYLRNIFNEYRGLVGSWKHGALGAIVLPLGMIMIGSGIAIFCLSVFMFARRLVEFVEVRSGIPLSYAVSTHGGFDWFYLPASMYLILAVATILGTLTMITMGKRLSKTPGSLSAGLASYVLLFGLIAPLWLMRATTDVALGIKRGWR